MLTRLLKPVLVAGKAIETASLIYVVGKVGVSAYKQIQRMNREARYAGVLRTKFEREYVAKFGKKPDEELVELTLRSYNAVEHPLRQRVKESYDKASAFVGNCLESNSEMERQSDVQKR